MKGTIAMVIVKLIDRVGNDMLVEYGGIEYYVDPRDLNFAYIRDGYTWSYINPRNLNTAKRG